MSDNQKLPLKSLLKFVLSYIQNRKIWYFLTAIILFYVVLGRSLPILFGRSIDLGIISKDLSIFKQYCLLFFAAGLLRATTGFILYYLVRKESNRISYKVRKHIFEHVLSLNIQYFDKNPSGKILTRIVNDTKSFKTLLGDGVIGIFISTLELISILIALTIEAPKLAVIVFLSFPISVFIGLRLAKKIQKEFFDMKEILSSVNTYLADSLNGFYIIKTYGYFKEKNNHFKELTESYFKKQMKISKFYALLWPQLDLFQLIASALCFGVGALLIQKGMMSIGSLIAFILLIQGFFFPLRYILESINQVQNGLTSAKRIQDVILTQAEKDFKMTSSVQFSQAPEIKISNMDFSYDPEKPIFQNYNLTFKAGKTTALIGRTGGGKTTLVSLLQRLYSPANGSIKLNDINLEDISNFDLRKNLCVVRQEDFIFLGSLAENIALTPPQDIDFKKAEESLNFSGITKGLNFEINSSGGNLSPGERQLLSFARIHYLSPKVVIFDEATSFIDEETEALIQNKSKNLFKDKTVIIIAHKKTTIEMCDELIELIPREKPKGL